jgi:hypothetical protein
MHPSTFALMSLIPVCVAAILALVLFGHRLTPETRRRIELAFTLVFYPIAVAAIAWTGIENWREADWTPAGFALVLAIGLTVQAVRFALTRMRRSRAA